jgi:hypothetical protein
LAHVVAFSCIGNSRLGSAGDVPRLRGHRGRPDMGENVAGSGPTVEP